MIGGGLLQAPFTSAAVKQLGDSVERKRPDDLSKLMEPSDETLRGERFISKESPLGSVEFPLGDGRKLALDVDRIWLSRTASISPMKSCRQMRFEALSPRGC